MPNDVYCVMYYTLQYVHCTAKFEENKNKKALQSVNIFHTPSNKDEEFDLYFN